MRILGDVLYRIGLLIVLAVGTGAGCSRDLNELPPQDEAAPELLGRFSGVYGSLSEGDPGRSLVLQLRDKVLLTPVQLFNGELRISRFSTILPVEDSGANNLGFNRTVSLILSDEESTSCIPADGINTLSDAIAFFTACDMDPMCDESDLCMGLNFFEFEESLKGDCVDDVCELPLDVGGALGRDRIQLQFDQETIVPPGGEPCILDGGQGRCFDFDKICDFDSRVAGVFTGTLTPEGGDPQPIDVGVALASNIPVVALLVGGSDRFFFGPFDPFSLTFDANDGDTRADPMVQFRPVADTRTVISGTLEEREDEGVVVLEATWVETAADSTVSSFTLNATRLAGSGGGTQCQAIEPCPAVAPDCVFSTESILETSIEARFNDGCVESNCIQTVAGDQLCAAIPDCGGVQLGDGILDSFEVDVACRDGAPSCNRDDQCLSITCAQPTCDTAMPPVCTPPPSSTWWELDATCLVSNPPPVSVIRSGDSQVLTCSDEVAGACDIRAAECLFPEAAVTTAYEVFTEPDGCPYIECRQSLGEDDLCDMASVPVCGGGDAPTPYFDEGRECMDFMCAPACTMNECTADGCSDPVCGYTEWPDCPGPVELRSSCSGCIAPTCGSPLGCDDTGMTCSLPVNGPADIHIAQDVGSDGCLRLTCEQTVRPFNFCTMDPPPTCNPGEAVAVKQSDVSFCLEYECLPQCSTLPLDCQGIRCADYAAFPQCPGDITVWDNCPGNIKARCGAATCPNEPVRCPLGLPSGSTNVDIMENLDQSTGCNFFSCRQTYDDAALCGGVPPTCSGSDVLMPAIRPGMGCVEFVCRDCSGCGNTAITAPLTTCPGEVVEVNEDCNSCVTSFCTPP